MLAHPHVITVPGPYVDLHAGGENVTKLDELSNPRCYEDTALTIHGSGVVDMACSGAGRYVTVQLVSSSDSVLRACQLQAFSGPPPTPGPSAANQAGPTPSFAAGWDVQHRYAPAVQGNALYDVADTAGPVGSMSGVVGWAGGLEFAGSSPCITFDASPVTTADFSVMVRFVAPVEQPHGDVVLWESSTGGGDARLFTTVNDTTGASVVGFALAGQQFWGGGVVAGASAAALATCSAGACAVYSA